MTPRQRVETVLRREVPDKTPLTMYECMIPQCEAERRLRNGGLCIVQRRGVVATHTPNVTTDSHHYAEDGKPRVRRVWHTPHGDLSTLDQPAGFTTWHLERMFKGPEDYKRLLFLVNDRRHAPAYEAFARAQEAFGDDAIFRAGIALSPLHQIMVHWMGVEAFAVEWAERRDEILRLHDAMVAQCRDIYRIVARSPASHANYGGNEVPEVMGRERLERYVVPLWNQAAAVLHEHGKLIGSHLDGNNRLWADLVAASDLDYVEAFTPAPDTDLTLAEALAAWPDKVLWINFPSSLHLAAIQTIEDTTRDLIRAAAPGDRLIIGITEDIPRDRWQANMLAIARVIDQETGADDG